MLFIKRSLAALIAAQLFLLPLVVPAFAGDDTELFAELEQPEGDLDASLTTEEQLHECVADNAGTLEELRSLREKYKGLAARYKALQRKSREK